MHRLKILTFNWHDPYIYLFAQTGHDIHVGDWMPREDGTRGWDLKKRPVPPNVTLIGDRAIARKELQAERFDLAVAHTLQDVAFLWQFPVPTVFLTHNALHNDGMNDPGAMAVMKEAVATFLSGRRSVFSAISQMKLDSWGLDGRIVKPGLPLGDYDGYTGSEATALSVGNLFVERDYMLGYTAISRALHGLPHRVVGVNPGLPESEPAEDWEALKSCYRTHRVYVNGTDEAFEDGYNLGMLEAMATGMPVVTISNASSPIVDGENGYVCDTPEEMQARIQSLLDDVHLARKLGAAARATVERDFSVEAFVAAWNAIFTECLETETDVCAAPSFRLDIREEDIFPFTREDVEEFLATADLDRVTVARLKLDRMNSNYLCDVSLHDGTAGRTFAWQGIEVSPQGGIAWPPFLSTLPAHLSSRIRTLIVEKVEAVTRDPNATQASTVIVDLNADGDATFRVGDDRVTPGDARSDIYLHHAKRYAFAVQFCAGKKVLEVGGGTGYGARILSRYAEHVVSVDLSGEAMAYGDRTFGTDGVSRMASDARSIALGSASFDTAVCFEMIEHIEDHDALLNEVRRLLAPDGTFVVSTPNKLIYDLPVNENPFHVGMLSREDFEALMRRHFEQVRLVAQKRALPEPFYESFGFDARPSDWHEVFIAVCQGPRPEPLPEGDVDPVSHARVGSVREAEPVLSSDAEIAAFFKQWTGDVKLNLGCGNDRREGYINVDAYVEDADLKLDIFDLPLAAGTVDKILSSHMLEHLGKYEVPKALADWHRVLKDGGRIQLNLPDLEWMVQHWLEQPESERWGWSLDALYGLQTHAGEHHKTGFTVARVEQLLAEAGFSDVVVTSTWSHGVRCVWAEAVRKDGVSFVDRSIGPERFTTQFTRDFSELFPYQASDVTAFLCDDDWRFGFVAFEHLTADGSVRGVSVALKRDDRQMVLQGLRVSGDRLSFPSYLDDLTDDQRVKIGDRIGSALQTVSSSPAHQNDRFVFASFGEDGNLGLEKTGERVIPGLTELSLYIPHVKRYLLAQTFASGKRVLDAGCGAGYGTKLLANVAERVDAVDIDPEAVAFCQNTFVDEKIDWSVADLRSFEPKANTYDLVTSFEVIEHLTCDEIPAYLERIRKSLKPDGVALISTPNRLVAEQWQNPFHHAEMTLEEFRNTLATAFDVQAVLGQTQWSPQTELQGQCAISRRLTDEDDMFIAVCSPRPVPVETEKPERQRQDATMVDIVIPLYNKVAYTKACLEGLEATRGDTSYNVVLVDNASTDETSALLSQWEDRADVVRSSENLGFARGNNLGAFRGNAPYVLFLNNDTVPEAGWLDALVREMVQDPAIGIVGAKLLYPDKRDIQHAGLEIINGSPDHVYRHASENDSRVNEARDLDMVTGACLLIRRDLFEDLSGFDEAYVNGVEDVDLCLRARDRGYRVRYCPDSVLVHHEGTSEGRYDHVQPNLIRFAQRFQCRFDGQGRFIPILKTPKTGPVAADGILRGIWEGTQFVHHSLSIVNTSLASELTVRDDVELSLVPYEPATYGPDTDPERLAPVAARLNAPLLGPPEFHVRHKWPPDFAAPPSGHWIVIQPWEFGRIPTAWVEPIQTKVDEVWVYSEYVRRCYLDSGVDADRVYVVPLGVDVARFKPDAKPIELSTEKSFKFLFVGGTIYRKGIDILLETYRRTFTADDDVCLVIKGMGDDTFYKGQTAGDLIKEIQAEESAPEVVYLTDILGDDEIAGLYTACDCLVHPYRGEGFGMPVAEAMACGLPVVVTEGGATDDFCTAETSYGVRSTRRPIAFQEETAGQTWLLDPDADHLAERMRQVLVEPEAARERGLKASEHVRSNLTWTRAADRIVERLGALRGQPVRRERSFDRGPNERSSSPQNGQASLNGEPRGTNGVAGEIPKTEETGRDTVNILAWPGPEGDSAYSSHALETRTAVSVADHHLIRPESDETVGAALNRVLGDVSSEFLVLLRSDVVVTDGWLDRLMAPLKAVDEVAATVPALPVGPDGQRVKARYKSVKKALTRFARQVAEKEGVSFDIESASPVCVVLRAAAVRALGGFEASMETDAFIDDLMRRFRQQGLRSICVPTVFVHAEGTDTIPLDEVRERKAVGALSDGDVLRARGDREGALARYREALDAKPVYLEAALIASAVLLELDRPLEAAEPFAVLEERYPDSARVKNYRGRCLFRAGEWEEAERLFQDALSAQPDFAEALGNLGVLFWEKGDLDQAVEFLGRAAEIAPNDRDIVYNVGMVYSQLGQTAEAASVLAHFLSLEPENLDARVHLAVLLIDTGDVDAGVGHLEAVLAEQPEHEDAMRVVGELQTILESASEEEES